jgi:glucose-1-phosphate thymidylyltransferase
MKCIILAGGFGTRLQSVSRGTPKPLLEVRGRTLIDHIVVKLPEDIEIIVSTNRKFEEQFTAWRKELPPQRQVGLFVEAARTEAEKPGAISALNIVIKEKTISEDLLVIAGDNYFEFDLHRFIAAYDRLNPLIAVYDVGDIEKVKDFAEVTLARVSREIVNPAHPGKPLALNLREGSVEGVFQVTGCIEKPQHPASTLVSIACYLFPPRIFPILDDYCTGARRDNLGSFISHLVKTGLVYAYVFHEKWYDIGSVETYIKVR